MTDEQIMQLLVHPYWCPGDPLLWETRDERGHKHGIANLARESKVGQFNLSWWLLDCPSPPRLVETYRRAPLDWAVKAAPKLLLNKVPLDQYAALHSLDAFNARIRRLLDHLPLEQAMLMSSHGVTLQHLRRLASRGHTPA